MKHLILWSSLFFATPTFALDRCSPHFTTIETKVNHLESLLANKTLAKKANAKIYKKFKSLKAEHPQLAERLQESSVYDVIIDEEFLVTSQSLNKVLDDLQKSITADAAMAADVRLREVLGKNLKGKVPTASIQARIDEFMEGGSLFRALGEKTFEETAVMYHGGNPLEPTADSILGKFIKKHKPATLKRSFTHGPGYTTFGPEKLVVAVDQAMMKDFAKLMKDEHLFAHYHTPEQGTLNVLHEDRILHWSGANNTKFSAYNKRSGTILPTVMLSSTEAQRMTQYMNGLADDSITEYVQKPWEMGAYCAKSGYNSCTHWVGNLPIGDEVVTAYTFPGKVDDYAYQSIHPDNPELDKLPRTQDLVPQYENVEEDIKEASKQLLKRIWKVPGNQQFSYLLGIGKANEYGQMANPGWVAHIFTSRIKVNRSPVVFVIVDDAKLPLAADFDLQISAH
ncbi:MAG: hypothetical protein ACOYL6_08715 [Bacteriovoracaceae bacterium]